MVGLAVNNEWNSVCKAVMVPYLKVVYWYSIGKVHACTGNGALYRPYGP